MPSNNRREERQVCPGEVHDCSRLDRAPSTLVDGQSEPALALENSADGNVEANGMGGEHLLRGLGPICYSQTLKNSPINNSPRSKRLCFG